MFTDVIEKIRVNPGKKAIKEELKEIASRYEGVSADNILYLIQEKANCYLVFLDSEGDLDWIIKDKLNLSEEKEFYCLLAKINAVQHQPCSMQLNKKMKKQFNCLLGNALVLAINGLNDETMKYIKKAEDYLKEREYEISRRWYVEFSVLLTFIIILFALGCRFILNDFLGFSVMQYIKTGCYGTVGVLLSILQNNAHINVKCTTGKQLVFCEVLSKVIVGMISSIIIVTSIKTGLFMSEIIATGNEQYFLMLICIVAGFSERLVPSLIEKIEGKGEEFNEKEGTNNI